MRTIKALISRLEAAESLKQAIQAFRLPEIQLLIDKADQLYYREKQQSGTDPTLALCNPILTDEQYDALKSGLKELEPEDPRLTRVGIPYDAEELRDKVPHAIPMGSLDNTDDGILGYRTWYEKTCKVLKTEDAKILASLKVDGGSIRVRYEKGQLVEAVTRGNGEVGENITANAANFIGVPTVLPQQIDLDVRGEAILYVADFRNIRSRDLGRPFDEIPENERSNARNIGNGILGRDNGKDSDKIQFLAFNVYNGEDFVTEQEKFEFLKKIGFQPVPHRICVTPDDVEQFYSDTADSRSKLPFEIDGIVVVLNSLDQHQRFITDDAKSLLRPKYARAIKFPHKSNQTKLLSVDVTVGHTGAIIPTAILEETRIGGVNVTHALLNNWDEIERLGVALNDTVEVILAGDIIPKILRVVEQDTQRIMITEPKRCPSCGEPTTRKRRQGSVAFLMNKDGAVTYCVNSDCPEIRLHKIEHWIGSSKKGAGILGIGDTILRAMWDEQIIQDAADLYKLTADDLKDVKLNGGGIIGQSRATKIVNAIQGKKNLPLHIFLGSLGIELLGRRRVQILTKAAEGKLDALSDWLDDDKLSKIEIEGFGDIIREAVREGINECRGLIQRMLDAGVTVIEPTSQPKSQTDAVESTDDRLFAGKTFCLTGTRECQDEIVELGGELTSSVAKTKPRPDFLVQKDPLSTSNKTQNAEANGHTQIISIEYLKQVIAGQASLFDDGQSTDALVTELTE